ncbi:hypothetical protein B0H14DRAFT_2849129 [Mycena olivaceomarginata]|nr:hypothetical protein B0H14DRAFT_2849129 [Mycena olivaceomarginata]
MTTLQDTFDLPTFPLMLSYSKSALVGAILETLAYRLYSSCVVLLEGLQIILIRKNEKGNISFRLLLISLVLFFFITMRMVLDNKAVVEGSTNDPITPHATDIYLGSFGNGAMFRTGTYIALTIAADIFVVYCMYAVWDGDTGGYALPALLAIAGISEPFLYTVPVVKNLNPLPAPDAGFEDLPYSMYSTFDSIRILRYTGLV